MKYLLASTLLLAFSAGAAHADHSQSLADARADLSDALEETRDDTRGCERAVAPILEDTIRLLRPARITPLRARRALRDVDDARDAARDCGRRVRRLLRSASRSLSRYAGGERRRDDREPAARPKPKRIAVPDNSYSRDCKTQWYMVELMDIGGAAPGDRALVANIGSVACGSAAVGELTWPSGRTARYRNGEWRYPNGRAARYANGELRYPNGRAARYANGELRYPDGRAAKYANGEWRYPNGRRAGSWQSIEVFACGAAKDGCRLYRERMRSSDPVFRELVLLRAAWEASKR